MSVTAPQAFGILRALIEANVHAAVTAMRWQDQDEDSNGRVAMPDKPATFVYTEFLAGKSEVIENGGGRGSNRFRNPAQAVIFVLSPRGEGLTKDDGTGCLDIAEHYAALFRPYNLNGIAVDQATAYPGGDGANLKPKGLDSAVDAYFYAACEVDFYFDLIG